MAAATMRAVRYSAKGPPSVMQLEDIPTPKPLTGEVLVRVEFAGVNPVDAKIRSSNGLLILPLPATPGKDCSGYVAEVGPDVTSVKVGDRVVVADRVFRSGGTYASYHVAKEEEVILLPDGYSLEEGASIGAPYLTAIRAIYHSVRGKAGETIFIHGASGQVGIAAVQLGVAHGFTVYGTAGTDEGLKRVLDNGAKAVFNHRKDGYLDEVKKVIGPNGPHIIIELVASTNFQHDLDLAPRRGRIAVIGGNGQPLSVNPAAIMAKELVVTGVMVTGSTPEEWKEMTSIFREGLAKRWIRPVIQKIYPLSDVVQAHTDIEASADGAQGRLVLKI
ncbi:Quinone oxidoreductase [Hypsibius exemplaris]|uniref:Quinone oxidoreductase n=1 Tax=Hypsibius exemplaris TaxID=2072580 RepID=A0A1W0XDR5_HYPEX|nr:Quinone oxidoreductase [Hypsibius exemplaris]